MKLTFISGSSIRRVFIKDRKITFIVPELKFQPLVFDLNKLDEQKDKFTKMKLSNEDVKLLYGLAFLNDEEAMAKDVISDFKKTGWRLIKKE